MATTKSSIYKALLTFKRHAATATECYMYSQESDLFMVDFEDKVTEFEVKVSRSDFNADFLKVDKHNRFRYGTMDHDCPNQFYYVCPDGMIQAEDIPDYAGLIWFKDYGLNKSVREMKKAPTLHNETMPSEFWKELYLKQQARKKL